jgi:hypothetical protein
VGGAGRRGGDGGAPSPRTKKSRVRPVARCTLEEAPLDGRARYRSLTIAGLFDRSRPPHALAAACGVFVRRRFPFAGRPFAQHACPERDARVFRPRSREAGPSRGMAPLEADPEAAHSLRPSAGGARVGAAPRARAVAPPRRRDGLLKPSRLGRGARTRCLQSRVNAREIRDPRAFHGIVDLDLGPTGSPGPPSRDAR